MINNILDDGSWCLPHNNMCRPPNDCHLGHHFGIFLQYPARILQNIINRPAQSPPWVTPPVHSSSSNSAAFFIWSCFSQHYCHTSYSAHHCSLLLHSLPLPTPSLPHLPFHQILHTADITLISIPEDLVIMLSHSGSWLMSKSWVLLVCCCCWCVVDRSCRVSKKLNSELRVRVLNLE